MENLILDLTGNGGGYLYSAFELADEFLDWGKMIVYTKGENSPKRPLRASSRGDFEKGKLVILIDEGSASASEIVTGAVQDWDRGLVIGRRSFGKGLVQKPYKLPDGSEIRLTIAKYYTPTGRCIQKPYGNGKKDYYRETFERFTHGELMHPDSVHLPDSLKYFTPNDRVVYGGGGIMPDIFIPLDTSQNSDYLREISRKGFMNEFALTYVDDNRKWFRNNFKDVGAFKNDFVIDDVLSEFYEFAAKEGVEKDSAGIKRSKELMSYQLKALLARNLWDVSAYYQVFNEYRNDYQKALNAMNDESVFSDLRVQK
jgi:carboxyl-terminal processing protease